ncbi:MAG TPA: hypothetical protein VKB34_09500, partial [Povalibacter sp.]|nr:hypothetical protein [Povalibacter sp.]
MKISRHSACRTTLTVLLTAGTATAGAAEWRIEPSIGSGVGYADNPRLLPDVEQGYANYQTDLSLPMSYDDGRTSFSVLPRWMRAVFPEDSLLDRNDRYLSLTGQRRYETASWSASAGFVRDTTLTSELGLTGL